MLRVRFDNLSIAEQEALTVALYSRADSWLGWGEGRESDHVLRSLGHILLISMRGLKDTLLSVFGRDDKSARKPPSLSIVQSGIILLLAAALIAASPKTAGQAPQPSTSLAKPAVPASPANSATAPFLPGQYHDSFTLADAGSPQIELHSTDSQRKIYFALPQSRIVRTATIHLHYAFSPALIPQLSQLKLILNGTLIATIQPAAEHSAGPQPQENAGPLQASPQNSGADQETDLNIPPALLVRNNTLAIEFIGHYTTGHEDPANTSLWARVHGNNIIRHSWQPAAPRR